MVRGPPYMMEDKIGGLYYVKVIFTHKSLLDLYCLYNIMRGSLMCEYPFFLIRYHLLLL